MLKYSLLLIGIFYLTGCSNIQSPKNTALSTPEITTAEPTPTPVAVIEEPTPKVNFLDKLLVQFQEWKGTRYRMGGISKSGTDCSGFVLMTFREKFGIELPRSTREQNKLGQDVKKTDLVSGDLVFFHTGRYDHVGIYLQDGQFLHASTRAGVKISNLSDFYWKTRYWKAKRLDLTQQIQKKI